MLEKVHEKQQTSVHFVFFKGTKGKQINWYPKNPSNKWEENRINWELQKS